MVSGDRHRGGAGEAAAVELLEEPADLLVDGGDLAVVRPAGVALAEGIRRLVGSVRVVEVDPEEERPLVVLPEPGKGPVHDLAAGPFRLQNHGLARSALDLVVVDLEAVGEAEAAVEHEGADEGAGAEPLAGEHGGESRLVAREGARAVVAQSMVKRQQPGEQAGMGREGERYRRGSLVEADALLGEAVEPGGLGLLVAIGAEMVGADGVDGDQHHVPGRGLGGALPLRLRAAGEEPQGQEGGQGERGQVQTSLQHRGTTMKDFQPRRITNPSSSGKGSGGSNSLNRKGLRRAARF